MYVNCTWLGRALHTAELRGGRLPFDIHTHTYLCSSYPGDATKIYRFLLKSWTDCHPTCTSSPWESFQLLYRYLEKYVNIGKGSPWKVTVILVAFPFPFSTLYVFTFSDLNNWHQNLGIFSQFCGFQGLPIPWNNVTWSCTPFQLSRPPVMLMHSSVLPRNAVFTLLYVSTTSNIESCK